MATRRSSKGKPCATEKAASATCQAETAKCQEEPSTVKQVAAAALVLGQNVRKTAQTLGVDRRTIQRWRKNDPDFRDAMNDTRREVAITARQMLLAVSEAATTLVETKLEAERSPAVAVTFMRGLGVLGPNAIEPNPPVSQPNATTDEPNAADGEQDG